MPDKPRNMGASVRARLLNVARQRRLDNNLLLTRYASLATWEASRADVGRPEFQRRHKLTRATIVCTAVPG